MYFIGGNIISNLVRQDVSPGECKTQKHYKPQIWLNAIIEGLKEN